VTHLEGGVFFGFQQQKSDLPAGLTL
jgi:hypothetical protein